MQELELKKITPSRTNPRKHFAPEAQKELAESIKKHGLLQPILVRPVNNHFEIVAGERRFRAAKDAGLETLPVTVRELTDTEALEIQVVENLQRTDLHPLEEAEGYRQLHEKHGYGIEDIAAKVGKSKAYIYSRLKFCGLPEPAKKAFLADKITASVALLIARIPDAGLAEKATKEILRGEFENGLAMTYGQAKRHIEDNYMLRLAEAPFDTKDADLFKTAGPCTTCPKRTGNQAELFSDIKGADVCTDPVCYEKKVSLSWQKQCDSARAKGLVPLDEKTSKRVFPYGDTVSDGSGYRALDEKCWRDRKGRTYRQLLGEAVPQVFIAKSPDGKVHQLVRASDADKVFKKKKINLQGESDASAQYAANNAEARRKSEIRKKIDMRAMTLIVRKIEKEKRIPEWRMIARIAFEKAGCDSLVWIAKRRGLIEKRGEDAGKALEKSMLTLKTSEEWAALALELIVVDYGFWGSGSDHPDQLASLSAQYCIDLKDLRKEVQLEEKKEQKKPSKQISKSQERRLAVQK